MDIVTTVVKKLVKFIAYGYAMIFLILLGLVLLTNLMLHMVG